MIVFWILVISISIFIIYCTIFFITGLKDGNGDYIFGGGIIGGILSVVLYGILFNYGYTDVESKYPPHMKESGISRITLLSTMAVIEFEDGGRRTAETIKYYNAIRDSNFVVVYLDQYNIFDEHCDVERTIEYFPEKAEKEVTHRAPTTLEDKRLEDSTD